jgi:hypothetical protein
MSNLEFESECVSSTTKNLTSWAKPTLQWLELVIEPHYLTVLVA